MKIIQLTDTHIVAGGGRIAGLDPVARLGQAVADINRRHSDAELCIISGDLTDNGEAAEYELLRRSLLGLRVPFRLMMGNHDDRENLLSIFPDTPRDGEGFIQEALETPEGWLLLLDTHEGPGVEWGSYCDRRLEWLTRTLERVGEAPVYLFMHHPPFAVGIPYMDGIALRDAGAFAQVVERGRQVRHLFFGHVHRPIAGSWRGLPISSIQGTNHQVKLDLRREDGTALTTEPPAYGVLLLEGERTIVHMQNFPEPPRPSG